MPRHGAGGIPQRSNRVGRGESLTFNSPKTFGHAAGLILNSFKTIGYGRATLFELFQIGLVPFRSVFGLSRVAFYEYGRLWNSPKRTFYAHPMHFEVQNRPVTVRRASGLFRGGLVPVRRDFEVSGRGW
jgi:hypothetical protein